MKIRPDEYCVVAAVAADTLDPCEGGRRADQMTVLDRWIVAIMFNERFLSCWGFYGDKDAIEEAKDMVAYLERTYDERLAKQAGQLLLPLAA